MARHGGGRTIILEAGDYHATIISVGAALAGLTYQGHDLTVSYDPEQPPKAWMGKALAPWPNRITDGKYVWQGEEIEVPINDQAHNAGLHGLVSWVEWTVAEESADRVVLEYFLPASYPYPFTLDLQVEYTLDADAGLMMRMTATNIGTEDAPYGASSHTFLSVDKKHNSKLELTVPASKVFTVNDNLAPIDLVDVAAEDLDYREARLIGDTFLDHAFGGLPEETWAVRLFDPETGRASVMESAFPWVQIYGGEQIDYLGVAVEPMTCPPDAFNSGTDLIVLKPGEQSTYWYAVRDDSQA